MKRMWTVRMFHLRMEAFSPKCSKYLLRHGQSMTNNTTLLPERLVAERYRVSTRTLRRWDATASLQFPSPVLIRGRRYRDPRLLEAWERERAIATANYGAPMTG
jgi:hypothetical protein